MTLDSQYSRNEQASARADLLLFVSTLVLLLILALPLLSANRSVSGLVICQSNQGRLVQSIRAWANEHGDRFSWWVPVPEGGTSGRGVTYEHWRVLSNHLDSPRSLVCPTTSRSPATEFALLRNARVSYMLGSDGEVGLAQTLVAGDQDIEGGNMGQCGQVGGAQVMSFDGAYRAPESYLARWSRTNHADQGNIALGDGSVHSLGTTGLKAALSRSLDTGNNSHSLIPN